MVEIRYAQPHDWSLVRDIRLRALADAPESFCARLEDDQARPVNDWRERLEGSNPTLIAVHEGRGVAMGGGFAAPDSDVATVWGMWTEPVFRGQGLGRRILEGVVAWARDAGRTPYLHVTEGNDDARALYIACGFEPTGVWEPLRAGSNLRIEEMALRRG